MKESMDKHTEDLTKKILQQAGAEMPSLDFTQSVMSKLEGIPVKSSVKYKPIIPKFMRFLIAVAFIVLIVYLTYTSGDSLGWADSVDFSFLSENPLSDLLSNTPVSKALLYTFIMFGLMLFFQITIIKRHHNKQFQV